MPTDEYNYPVRDEHGTIIATLWCEIVGEPTMGVYCPECGEDAGMIADYAMGVGGSLAGLTRRFMCGNCCASVELPDVVQLVDNRDD